MSKLEEELKKEHDGGRVAPTLFHRCFRWLRNTLPRPRRMMIVDGELQTVEETHQCWIRQVAIQSGSNAGIPTETRTRVEALAKQRAQSEVLVRLMGRSASQM